MTQPQEPAHWDQSVDFLVVGSGAAAMSAAIRAHDLDADVLMIEKSDRYGGSTAMSGGVCWVPDNPTMKKTGISDSREEGLSYLKHITKGEISAARLETYVDGAHRFLDYCNKNTHVRFDALEKYTDYYPEQVGGKPGGRSMESRVVSGDSFLALEAPPPGFVPPTERAD